MVAFVLFMALFVTVHLAISGTSLRGVLIARLGLTAYRALFAVASAVGLIGAAWCYNPAGSGAAVLWDATAIGRLLAIAIMLPAWILLVGALSQRNPTALGQETGLDRGAGAATGMLRVTRHPFMVAVVLWALAHLLNKGDIESLILFGGFAAVAGSGTAALDAKALAARGEAYRAFTAVTSIVPFAAIIEGRNRLVAGEIGWWRPALGGLLWIATLGLHQAVFGVPALPI